MENKMEFIVNEIMPMILFALLMISICFIGDDISTIRKEIENMNISKNNCIEINEKIYCEKENE